MKLAVVEWDDAYAIDADDNRDFYPQTSIGFLFKNTKKVVKIAQTYNEDGPAEILTIPRAYVRSIRVVGNQRVKRAKKR